MLFSGIFTTNVSNILEVWPEMTFSDFWLLCIDSNSIKSTVPSMGGHLIVASTHGEKNYVCLDVGQAINKTLKESNLARHGAYGFKTIFKVPDVVCSGLEKGKYPSSGQNTG